MERKFSLLEKLHARAAKIVCKLRRGICSEQAISKSGSMKLSYIYKKRIAVFMHSCYFNGIDSRLVQLYEKDPARSSRKNSYRL